MTFSALLTQTATVVHYAPTGSDAEGNSTFGAAVETTYPALLQQTNSTETVEGERRSTTNLTLFLPAEAAGETFEDEVLVDGERYQVEGQPAVLRTPRGVHHVETAVRRVTSWLTPLAASTRQRWSGRWPNMPPG